MSSDGLSPPAITQQYAAVIPKSETFKTLGLSREVARDFLKTDEGSLYWWRVAQAATPSTPSSAIDRRAINQLTSGLELPRLVNIETGEPLVKFVAQGSSPTAYTPFWARESKVNAALAEGRNISDYFALPVGSEAPRYGMYRITPEVPTQIFINTVAPTSELGGLVSKSGGAEQVLVPNRKLFHEPVYIRSVDNIPSIAAEAEHGALSSGTVRGAGVLGAAAIAYDAATAATHSYHLLQQHNVVGAQSEVLHFGSGNLGMLGGAVLGAELGAAVGWETGPGAFVTTTAGGVAGLVAGDKIASVVDERRIYTQDDKEGIAWHFNPKDPEKGWTRTIESTQVDLNPGSSQLKPFSHQIQVDTAGPELASELSYKASGQAVQIALAHAPNPHDPYSLPASALDPHSIRESNWIRDAQTHAWNRRVDTSVIEHGQYVSHEQIAGSQRATELDRASETVLAQNAAQTRHAIAAHYQAGFDHFDWRRFGAAPETVTEELRQPATKQRGSDGEVYIRGTDGEWLRPRWFGDKTAEGNLRDELNDAFQRQSGAQEQGSPEASKQSQRVPDRELTETGAPSENLSKESNTGITPQSSNRDMFKALMTAAQNVDIDAMRSISNSYLQSPQGQAWLEQGQQLNQQQAVVQQQAAMDAQQQSQVAAQGPMR